MSGFSAYTGLSGSGKSYNVVQHVMIPAIERGQVVWTNIPLNKERWIERFGTAPHEFDLQDIKANPDWPKTEFPKGALLVLDEAQMVFSSGMKGNQIPEPWKDWFTQYRHHVGTDGNASEFVLVTQDLNNVSAFVRNLVGVTYRHVKLEMIGAPNRFNVHQYQGPATGPNPPERNKIQQTGPHKYKPQVYELYRSATQSDTGTVGDESRADKRVSIWRGTKIWSLLFWTVALVLLGGWSVTTVWEKTFGGSDRAGESVQVVDGGQTQGQASRPAKPKRVEPLKGLDMYIAFNNGHFPRVDYTFLALGDSHRSKLKINDLRRLGYEIEPITECMVMLKFESSERAIFCQLPDREKQEDSFITSHL